MLTITRKCLIHINKLGIRPFLSIDRHKIAKIEDYSKTHLRVGDFIEVEWAFKQNEISNFLSVIGDENPIHYDENYVKKYTKFSRVIVPGNIYIYIYVYNIYIYIYIGMMAGFLFTKIISEYLPTPIHIQQELKFCQPIFEGEEVIYNRYIIFLDKSKTTADTNTKTSKIFSLQDNN